MQRLWIGSRCQYLSPAGMGGEYLRSDEASLKNLYTTLPKDPDDCMGGSCAVHRMQSRCSDCDCEGRRKVPCYHNHAGFFGSKTRAPVYIITCCVLPEDVATTFAYHLDDCLLPVVTERVKPRYLYTLVSTRRCVVYIT